MAIYGYVPGYNRNGSDDRRGDGLVLRSGDYTLVIDGFDGTSPTTSLIRYLKQYKCKKLNILLTHPHHDHYKGLRVIMADSYFTIMNFYCYNPDTIKHGFGTSSNGKSVKEDYNNFQNVLKDAKNRKANIVYLNSGDKVQLGDIIFKIWRKQPTIFTQYDQGEAYAFINDGSLCTYFPDFCFLTTGDGPYSVKECLQYFNNIVIFFKVPHHGNSCSKSNAEELKKRGCKLAYQTNNEKNGAGTTGFTAYGSRRVKEQGIPVIQLDKDINFTVSKKKLVITQGSNTWNFDVPYEDKNSSEIILPSNNLYRVRKTWKDSKSQIGAYRSLSNAKNACDKAGAGYSVFNENGEAIYTAKAKEPAAILIVGYYRVRKSWKDSKSQIGAFKTYKNAKAKCDSAGKDYHIFDNDGNLIY